MPTSARSSWPFLCLSFAAGLPACAAAQNKNLDAKHAQELVSPPPARVADPMASFARMVGGEWKVTAASGTSMYDTCHWGPGKHSGRVMTHGQDAAGNPWRGLAVVYWHPARKRLCSLGLNPYAGSVSEDTITVEGETSEAVSDLYQDGVHRKLVSRTTFEGPDKYHAALLEEVEPGKLTPLNEWDYFRSRTLTPLQPLPTENPPKPSARLKALEPLLRHTWYARGKWGAGTGAPGTPRDAFHIESTFEWIPYIDAIYARTFALRGNGEPTHLLDAYFYHHTGTGRLRCLALSNLGGVYEGDLTVLDGGALQLDLKGYEGERSVAHVVRFDFEKDGTLHHRVWSLRDSERTLMLDVHHKVSQQKQDRPAGPSALETSKQAVKAKALDNSAHAADPPEFIGPPANHDPYFTPTAAKVTSTMPRVIIRNIREDRAGNIWFATFGGPIRYDGKNFTNFSEEVGLAETRVFSLLEDRAGAMWFGSITGGASRYDGKSFTRFTEGTGLANNDVLWIFQDRDANIWFGTGNGVSRYDGKSMTNFTTKEGLVHDSVYAIAQDASGRMWFGTQGGICSDDGKSFSNLADDVGRSFLNIRSMVVDRSGNL